MKEDKRQGRERHFNKTYHHGTRVLSRGKKITLSLTDKVKFLDLHKQKPKLGCRPLAELFKETSKSVIGKLQIAKIIKNESNIRREYENFKGDMKRKKIARYGIINDVLYMVELFILMEQCCKWRLLKLRLN